MIAKYAKQAEEIDARLKSTLERINRRDDLSPIGKQQEAQSAREAYNKAIAELQENARLWLRVERGAASKAMAAVRAEAIEKQRALLGDVVLSDLYRRRLELLDAGAIVRAHANAASEWEKSVVGEYGRLILQKRIAQGQGNTDTYRAINELDAGTPAELSAAEKRMAELDFFERQIPSLDPVAWRSEVADAAGVAASRVPSPFAS